MVESEHRHPPAFAADADDLDSDTNFHFQPGFNGYAVASFRDWRPALRWPILVKLKSRHNLVGYPQTGVNI